MGKPSECAILHEWNPRFHYRPLALLQERGEIGTLRRGILRGREVMSRLRPRQWPDVRETLDTVLDLTTSRHKTVVFSAAPYHPSVLLGQQLRGRHRVIYHCSWPYWEEDRVPWAGPLRRLRPRWERFLDGLEVVAVTQRVARALEPLGARCVRIPHPVDTELFSPGNGIPKEDQRVRILYVGDLVARKGVDLLLDLASQPPFRARATFWFVGRGPLESAVRRTASEGPGDVRAWGYLSNRSRLAEMYRSCDLLALPSRPTPRWTEVFGIVLIEAMASGLPVVATRCPGPEEVVEEDRTGLLVAPNSRGELAQALETLVDDEGIRRRMGLAGRQATLSEYALELVTGKWREVLCGESLRPDLPGPHE